MQDLCHKEEKARCELPSACAGRDVGATDEGRPVVPRVKKKLIMPQRMLCSHSYPTDGACSALAR